MHTNSLIKNFDRPAFTLIEILVVVAIIGIIAAMVVPMIGDTSDIEVAAAARMVVGDMEYAQGQAIMTQLPVTVTFNKTNGTYALTDNGGTTLTHPVNKDPFSISLTGVGYDRISFSQVNFNNTSSVTFDSMGSPDNAGRIILSCGASGIRIDVSAVTGKTTITTIGS